MPKLAVYRGSALVRELGLAGQSVRIGRADQNDLVLEDPTKGVSRQHAELSFDSGRYTLKDLGSENGLYAGNRRQAVIVLQADEPVTMGPYTLILRQDAADGTMAMRAPLATSSQSASYPSQSASYPARPAPRREPAAAMAQRFPPAVAPGRPVSGAPGGPVSKPMVLLAFAVIVVMIVVSGLAYSRSRAATVTRQHLLAGEIALDARNYDEARLEVEQVLAVEPTNKRALELKEDIEKGDRGDRGRSGHLDNAKAAFERQQMDLALSEVNAALDADPANNEARALLQRIRTTSASPVSPPRTVPAPVPFVPKPAPARVAAAAPAPALPTPGALPGTDVFNSARSAAEKHADDEALRLLDQLEREHPGFPGAGEQMRRIGARVRDSASAAWQEGKAREAASDWLGARTQYLTAEALVTLLLQYPGAGAAEQASADIASSLRRVRDRLAREGDNAYKNAKIHAATGFLDDARKEFKTVVDFLAADDPRRQDAAAWLAQHPIKMPDLSEPFDLP